MLKKQKTSAKTKRAAPLRKRMEAGSLLCLENFGFGGRMMVSLLLARPSLPEIIHEWEELGPKSGLGQG